jgi:hypothetical protein
MSAEILRTSRDDALDGLRKLDDAEREIRSWRAHLERVAAEPSLPATLQARRSARIVAAVVGEADGLTHDAVRHAEAPLDVLRTRLAM